MHEHTVEPEPRTIEPNMGRFLGADAAECAHCGQSIEGGDRGWFHLDDEEDAR